MQAYGGNNLMNMVVSLVYTAQRNKFKGSGTQSGMSYSFDVTETPVAKLVSGKAGHNLEIEMKKVAIKVVGGPVNFDKVLTMKATGKLVISQGKLTLSGLTISTTSGSPADQVIAGIINTQVIPKLTAALQGIPIPQLTNVFGSGLSASVTKGQVISGPALEVSARISGKSGIAAADAPAASNISSLNTGSATNALMIAMLSSGAVNVLIKALLPPLAHAFDKRASKFGFGAGIKGTIKATTPILKISNGTGRATTTISFSGLKGGIDAPFVSWKWVTLSAPNVEVVVKHKLTAVGNAGVITLTGVESLNVNLSWPTILRPVEALVEGLLNGILSFFRGMISNAVAGKKFEIFKLPTKIPGTTLNAKLSFDSGGLGFFKSSVRALVRIRKAQPNKQSTGNTRKLPTR